MGSYEEEMARADYEAEMDAKAEYESQLDGEAMAMQEQQEIEAKAQYIQEQEQKALKLIKEADWDTIRQMIGFLFEKETLKLLVWNRIEMIAHCIEHKVYDNAEKELNDFIQFFEESKSELSKKYDEIFKKDIEDIKKDDYIEIDELLKTDKKMDAMMEAKERKDEEYPEKRIDK